MTLPRTHLLPVSLLLLACATNAQAADAETEDNVTAKLGGRLHWDIADFDNDTRGTPNANDSDLRALWLDMSGKFYGFNYKLEADFSGDEVLAKDVYVSKKFAPGTLTVGQFKQYFRLDDRISSNHMTFIERSYLVQNLAPTYRLGAAWLTARDGYTVGGSIYSLESIDVWQTEGLAVAARGTYAPWREEGKVLHLGLSLAHEDYEHPGGDGATALRIRPRPAGIFSDNSRVTLADFSQGRDTRVDKYSLELAAVKGAWTFQGEAGGARFDDGEQQARLSTGYAQVAWMLTGEVRPYDAKAGRFGRINPQGRAGAWELALRYDTLSGRQQPDGEPLSRDMQVSSLTAGVNWYPRPHLRLMLNWIDSRNRDRLQDLTLDRTRALVGRVQIDF